ncbi:hypothetical protein N5V54_22050, partial [Escherichia coli]
AVSGRRVVEHHPCPTVIAVSLYTSDAADDGESVDLGGRRIIKKKKKEKTVGGYREYKVK